MENTLYLQKLHSEILNIMDVIHDICQKNNIKYYLTGGSLLGAIRHKGFIPWDDDLDIVMPRPDFDHFLEISKTSLPSDYVVEWITTNPKYWHVYAKVCNKKTVFSEMAGGFKVETGIFVDVFPIDETSGCTKTVNMRKWLLRKISVMMGEKARPGSLKGIKKLLTEMFSQKTLHSFATALMCIGNGTGKLYYTNFGSQYTVKQRTQLKTTMGKGMLSQFENRMYMIPDNYEAVLLSTFGPKYMELPPVEKRKIHYPVRVVFSDGSIYEHNTTEKKLSISESLDW